MRDVVTSKTNAPTADAPNGHPTAAMLIVDTISHFEFEDGERLFENAVPAAENVAKLKARAKEAGLPVIYVNDNFGMPNDDFTAFVKTIEETKRGKRMVDLLRPDEDDHHVLKPQRSGFYATPLGTLLFNMNVSNVIVTGLTTDICVLFTAHDAYVRGFDLHVPSDCTAAVETKFHDDALNFLHRVADANVSPSQSIPVN